MKENVWRSHFSGASTILFAEVLYSRLELGIGLRRGHSRKGTERSDDDLVFVKHEVKYSRC